MLNTTNYELLHEQKKNVITNTDLIAVLLLEFSLHVQTYRLLNVHTSNTWEATVDVIALLKREILDPLASLAIRFRTASFLINLKSV